MSMDIERIKCSCCQLVDREWFDATEIKPAVDENVIVTVSGTYNNITFEDAIQLAQWDDEEGWILEEFPGAVDISVTGWMFCPEPYRKRGKKND